MPRSVAATKRKYAKRMDTLLALPLERFRRALTDLTPDELSALEARIAVQRVKNRWARGGFGVARHRSPLALSLLARREAALRHEQDARLAAAPTPVRLIPRETERAQLAPAAIEDRAA